MRLKQEKVENLSNKILAMFSENELVKISGTNSDILNLIREIIFEDMRVEDVIEEEAKKSLESYREKIYIKNLSYSDLLQKAKKIIAKEKKFTL